MASMAMLMTLGHTRCKGYTTREKDKENLIGTQINNCYTVGAAGNANCLVSWACFLLLCTSSYPKYWTMLFRVGSGKAALLASSNSSPPSSSPAPTVSLGQALQNWRNRFWIQLTDPNGRGLAQTRNSYLKSKDGNGKAFRLGF